MNYTLISNLWLQPLVLQDFLAQTSAPTTTTTESNPALSPITQFLAALGLGSLGGTLLNLIGAIIIFVLGWIIASIVKGIVKNLLKRTDIDNRLASSVSGGRAGSQPQIEDLLGSVVFWILFILAVVASLNVLQLTTVAAPLNSFLNQIFAFLPRLGSAALLVGLAWVLATLAKAVVIRSARSFSLDERLADHTPTDNRLVLSETLGNALYWFVFLFFLPLILGVLDLQGPLQPVQNLLNDILAALPRILKAVVIGAIGWLIARIVRGIVTNLLSATGVDRIGAKFGLRGTTGGQSLSWLLGTIVYVLILIPTAIAALDALQIEAISAPAIEMLNQILRAIPQIFTAILILAIAYVVGRFIGELVTSILTSIGFNNIFNWLGFPTTTVTTRRAPYPDPIPLENDPSPVPRTDTVQVTQRTPSEIIGIVVVVGVMLFATVAATNILNIPALTALVSGLLIVFGRILSGLVVFAVGLYLANLAFSLITSSGSPQARILGQTARIAIIALVSAMALQQMGIASSIVNLAFGLLLGAIAVAIALAFGLGGREVAGNQLQEWLSSFKNNRPPQ
ncbi:mechanosensitive ion channel [Chroococcus sp. FPU101]|uniref:mechanosensitive ion channel n=1 Tax=Chroococcus sp. FPU101 TaxID=1974212 RepID=UPI001A8CCCA8|nr:mechanosensitive ion channel [Chroococcus sp. FPU101]